MTRLISEYKLITVGLRRSYILNYLATRPNLQNFVIQGLVTLLAKITKFGWLDVYKQQNVFRNIVEDVKKFLQVKRRLSVVI